ncbi:MAG: hypothetical protein KOO60_08285 [Gemmatimonadales bacterium]|nr:hypothetical protein [Gemmatimonadales bacterium]
MNHKKLLFGSRFLLVLISIFFVSAGWSRDQAPEVSARDQMILRMLQLGRAGRIADAREAMRSYLVDNPTDGVMFYNLTCLDLMLDEKEQALQDMERALSNGFTNFRIIETDRDIRSLRNDPRFVEMVTRSEEKFRSTFQSRALFLDEGYLAEGIVLHPAPQVTASGGSLNPEISVSFNSTGLQINLSVDDFCSSEETPPWKGGCGVLVNLVQPMSPDDYESRRYFSFGFYSLNGRPQAVLVGKHGKVLLQPEPGLVPVITRQGSLSTYEIAIPWEQFKPYAPPLDQEMGLNIFYLGAGQGASRPVYSLMDEENLSFSASPWRRYVPINFLTSDRTVPVMRGRLYERLAQGDSLGVQLVLWSETEGQAQCSLSIHPQGNPTVTVGTPVGEIFPCETELNFLNTYIPLNEIPSGSYNVLAEISGPGGLTFTQEFPFDNLEQDWISSLNERVYALKIPEQSTLYYHLFALARQLDYRHPQEEASGLHMARAEVVRLIELCEAGGSCLPDSGLFRGGFTSDVMTQRFCSMYLPQGYREWDSPQLLVVLPPEPGSEDDLARSLGEALAGKAEVIVMVPQSHGYSSLALGKTADETALALEWARSLFSGGPVTLVGLGKSTDAALETSLRRPDLCKEVFIEGDQIYSDLIGFSEAAVWEALGDRSNPIPYYLTHGTLASPRLPVIVPSMRKLGLEVTTLSVNAPAMNAAALATWFLSHR